MKKLLIISLALLFSAFLNAQGTLQFDHVIWQTFNSSGYTLNVPSGQVFKLTAVYLDYPGGSCDHTDVITIDNGVGTTVIAIGAPSTSQTIWLPSGSYIFDVNDPACASPAISGIFFNVIQ